MKRLRIEANGDIHPQDEDVEFVDMRWDASLAKKIVNTPPDDVQCWTNTLRLPSANSLGNADWHEPRTLESLIGVARQECSRRAEMLTTYPVTREECDALVAEMYETPYNAYADFPLHEEQARQWLNHQAFAEREYRIIQALDRWIHFADQFLEEQRRISLSYEHGAGAIIERIENRIVYWKGNAASLSWYLNRSPLWNHRTANDRARWAKVVFRIKGEPAKVDRGNISAAKHRSAGQSTKAVDVKKVDMALLWFSVVPKKRV